MIVSKIYFHIATYVKKLCLKLVYGSDLKIGKNLQFRKGFSLLLDGGKIHIGDNVFFNNYCTICALQSITIGDGTIFGENVKIYDHNHIYADLSIPIKEQGYKAAPIAIGNHCWVASNVVILKGVTIGNNCVIGAGCVVYKDIPANTLVVNRQNLCYKQIVHTQ